LPEFVGQCGARNGSPKTKRFAACNRFRFALLPERNCRLRVIRENRIIGEYAMDSLKREKNDAKEVREGFECGIKLAGFNDLKEGDILEAYKVEEIARTL
jgi:translation initiation factor IF-2